MIWRERGRVCTWPLLKGCGTFPSSPEGLAPLQGCGLAGKFIFSLVVTLFLCVPKSRRCCSCLPSAWQRGGDESWQCRAPLLRLGKLKKGTRKCRFCSPNQARRFDFYFIPEVKAWQAVWRLKRKQNSSVGFAVPDRQSLARLGLFHGREQLSFSHLSAGEVAVQK